MEIWKDVKGYEGSYQISNLGKLKSFKSGKILKPCRMKIGYECYYLMREGKKRVEYIHRLIAIHFIPNPENKPQINHINSIRDDNTISNLEWVTSKENLNHAEKKGRMNKPKGQSHFKSKLTESEVIEILQVYKTEKNQSKIARAYGVNSRTVNSIVLGYTWKHIPR